MKETRTCYYRSRLKQFAETYYSYQIVIHHMALTKKGMRAACVARRKIGFGLDGPAGGAARQVDGHSGGGRRPLRYYRPAEHGEEEEKAPGRRRLRGHWHDTQAQRL